MMEEHGNFRLFVKISHYHRHSRKIVKSATYHLENADQPQPNADNSADVQGGPAHPGSHSATCSATTFSATTCSATTCPTCRASWGGAAAQEGQEPADYWAGDDDNVDEDDGNGADDDDHNDFPGQGE